jgi:hypothetical protein
VTSYRFGSNSRVAVGQSPQAFTDLKVGWKSIQLSEGLSHVQADSFSRQSVLGRNEAWETLEFIVVKAW